MIYESRKILHDPNLKISATCVRVPVVRAHSESVNIEFEAGQRPTLDAARSALGPFPRRTGGGRPRTKPFPHGPLKRAGATRFW